MFDYDKVDVAVSRIADAVNPKRMIVFGSVARKEADDGSDLDILVLFDHEFDERSMYVLIKRQFIGLKLASDIILMTESDFDRYSGGECSFAHEIASTGRIAYTKRKSRICIRSGSEDTETDAVAHLNKTYISSIPILRGRKVLR